MLKNFSEKSEKNAVAYMRCASTDQSDENLERQNDAIIQYCSQQGIHLVKKYVDKGFSGTTDKRPAFQRLKEDIQKNRDWDTVLIYDMSRFCRAARDAVYYKAMFKEYNVAIVSVAQSQKNVDEHSILEIMAALYGRF